MSSFPCSSNLQLKAGEGKQRDGGAVEGSSQVVQEEAGRPPRHGGAALRRFRKQRALWRREVRDVTPARAAAVASAAAAVASEAPGSLQGEENRDPLSPQV